MTDLLANSTVGATRRFAWSHLPAWGLFKKRWVYHSLFWILYYMFIVFVSIFVFHIPLSDHAYFPELALLLVFDIGLVYFNFYFLIPRLLQQKKYVLYGCSLLVAILAITFLDISIRKIYAHYFGSKVFAIESGYTFYNVAVQVVREIYLLGFTTGIKLAKDWIQNQQRLAYISDIMKEREKQYLEAELNFLKSQIQPHFFFNTLNNLYSLTLKKSDHAPEVVLKLSDLMSYMLYESNTSNVSLKKEITCLQNYLDLEKLRFGKRLDIRFEIEGHFEEVCIPPLLLILFVENSFKHGAKDVVDKIEIEISLNVGNGFLFFRVKNPVSENKALQVNAGIGLKNVRRRLELLYGRNFNLETFVMEKEYVASLKIPV